MSPNSSFLYLGDPALPLNGKESNDNSDGRDTEDKIEEGANRLSAILLGKGITEAHLKELYALHREWLDNYITSGYEKRLASSTVLWNMECGGGAVLGLTVEALTYLSMIEGRALVRAQLTDEKALLSCLSDLLLPFYPIATAALLDRTAHVMPAFERLDSYPKELQRRYSLRGIAAFLQSDLEDPIAAASEGFDTEEASSFPSGFLPSSPDQSAETRPKGGRIIAVHHRDPGRFAFFENLIGEVVRSFDFSHVLLLKLGCCLATLDYFHLAVFFMFWFAFLLFFLLFEEKS